MKRYNTKGIILTRIDYAEADRILTFLTPNNGKVKAIAKGVRRSKSKLAGGIELFSISELTLIIGKSDIHTIISTRLVKHFGNIVKDIVRTQAAYDFLKIVNKATAEQPEEEYFNLLEQGLESLNNLSLDLGLTSLWFDMQLLKISGHSPNLHTDARGVKLASSKAYEFQIDNMRFTPQQAEEGRFKAEHIKFLRLGFSAAAPQVLNRINGYGKLASATQPLVQSMLQTFVRT